MSADRGGLLPLTAVDFHVLLVLGGGPLYGYAIMKSVAEESGGTVAPEIGSLYRTLGKLVTRGLVEEADEPLAGEESSHPGKRRRYFQLTELGRTTVRADARRQRDALDLARQRDLLPEQRHP